MIKSHSFIPNDDLVSLAKTQRALDSILSLHYTSHTSQLPINKLLLSLVNVQPKATVNDVLKIISIYPSSYGIKPTTEDHPDPSPCFVVLNQSIFEFNKLLNSRSKEFISALNHWIDTHGDDKTIPFSLIDDHIKSTGKKSAKSSPKKVTKLSSELKNSSQKFRFNPKDEKVQAAKNNSLSLLDRIRLKENTKSEPNTVEEKRSVYLHGKLVSLYNIVAQIKGSQECLNIALKRLSLMIKDSMEYPMHNHDIVECLYLMEKKLTSLTITSRNDFTVVKVTTLDRTHDIKCLQS